MVPQQQWSDYEADPGFGSVSHIDDYLHMRLDNL